MDDGTGDDNVARVEAVRRSRILAEGQMRDAPPDAACDTQNKIIMSTSTRGVGVSVCNLCSRLFL